MTIWGLCVLGSLNTIRQLVKYLEKSLKCLYPFPVISGSCLTCLYLYITAWNQANPLADFSL